MRISTSPMGMSKTGLKHCQIRIISDILSDAWILRNDANFGRSAPPI